MHLDKLKTRLQAKIGCEQRCSDFIKSRNDVFWMQHHFRMCVLLFRYTGGQKYRSITGGRPKKLCLTIYWWRL